MSFLSRIVRNVARYRYINQVATASSVTQNVTRDFSCNPTLCAKMHMEHENRYAYNIMRDKGFAVDIETVTEYSPLDKSKFQEFIDQDWSSKSPSEIFEVFPILGAYCKQNNMCISNTIFDKYIDNLTDNVSEASDEELKSIFYALNQWPEPSSTRTRNWIEVWVALDDACLSRLNNWTPDEMLTFISLFFMLNITKASDATRKMLDKLAYKAKKLTLEQVVQTLFFVGVQRRSPHDMHNLEVHLENNFSEFSVDDLAIIAMGFFKSKVPIRSDHLTMRIMEKVMENSKTIHEVSLAALLKVVRYSMKVPFDKGLSLVYELLDTLQAEVPRLSVMCNVHMALLGTTKLVLHKGCFDVIAQNVIEKLPETRIKDLERLVLSYGTFRYTPKTQHNLFEKIMDELRNPEREDEIKVHGRSFACCVQYFDLMSLYPVDLINKVLNPGFLKQTYGKYPYNYGKEILTLSNIAQIFLPEEKINLLTEKEAKMLSNKYTDYVPRAEFQKQYNVTEKMFIEVVNYLREILGGKEFVLTDHILTHHQRGDIILCSKSDGTPLPVEGKFRSNSFGTIRKPPDDNKWTVLVIAGRNAITHRRYAPTGPFHVKLEELRRLGYYANLVQWHEYTPLSTTAKKEYLSKCINEAINENTT